MAHSTVTTARAAEIVGVGYEGLRSYLKRGLGGRVGMPPGFHKPGADTHDDPIPRAKWKRFSVPDLCLFRVAKLLIDAGFTFEAANAVVSRHDRWSAFAHDEKPVHRMMAIWPPYGDHIIYEPDQMDLLQKALNEAPEIVTLINLGEVHAHVLAALPENVGSTADLEPALA
ncbi:MAG: hypothetical protein RLZZ444_2912 [Pseudomonadota bacterium]